MLFMLLVVTPITIVVWLLIKLFRPKSKISFDNLAVGIGAGICMIWVFGLFVGGMFIAIYQIISQHLWLLYIIIPGYAIAGLVCLVKVWQQRRQGHLAQSGGVVPFGDRDLAEFNKTIRNQLGGSPEAIDCHPAITSSDIPTVGQLRGALVYMTLGVFRWVMVGTLSGGVGGRCLDVATAVR